MSGSRSSSTQSMSLEEARSVRWLRNNPRPLGELFDEGFLTEDRLRWAAQKAYDPKLKQAAAVLLGCLKEAASRGPQPSAEAEAEAHGAPAVQVGISIDQARATPWPFKPYRGLPMGALVDARQLSLKDLGFAVDTAWEKRVRQAAILFLAKRLSQAVEEPAPMAGPLKVVSPGRSYAERRQYALTFVQGLILGALVLGLSLLLIWWIARPRTPHPTTPIAEMVASPAGVVALIIIILGFGVILLLGLFLRRSINRIDRAIEAYRRGQEGEEQAVEALRQSLDGQWTLFRNVVLPGRNRGDIDGILVGPPGVWALEIKNLTGEYRNVGERWERAAGRRWMLVRPSPSRQAQDNAARLATFLRADGLNRWVNGVVVWANRENLPAVENPMVAVWPLDRLPEELANLWQSQVLLEPEMGRILAKLRTLCQRQEEEIH